MEVGELHPITADLSGLDTRFDLTQRPVTIKDIIDGRRI